MIFNKHLVLIVHFIGLYSTVTLSVLSAASALQFPEDEAFETILHLDLETSINQSKATFAPSFTEVECVTHDPLQAYSVGKCQLSQNVDVWKTPVRIPVLERPVSSQSANQLALPEQTFPSHAAN